MWKRRCGKGRIGYEESGRLLRFYEEGLNGYTYLEDVARTGVRLQRSASVVLPMFGRSFVMLRLLAAASFGFDRPGRFHLCRRAPARASELLFSGRTACLACSRQL